MILKVDSTFYNKISGMIPKLHYKLRSDYMSIDGKRLYYDDIFKLICKKSGNRYSYKPSFMLDASEISENDIVLDAFPFYIVALVDLMLYHDATDILSVDLFSYVTNVMVITDLKGKSFDEAINNLNSLTMDENINFFACMQSIRGTNLDSSLPRVRKFINLMLYQYMFDKKSFFETFFSLIDYLQIFIELELSSDSFCDSNGGSKMLKENEQNLRYLHYNYSKYSYKSKDKKYNISNGRGIAFSLLGIFYCYFYSTYKSSNSYIESVSDYTDSIVPELHTNIRKCLGDDLVVTFITDKTCGFKDLQQTYSSSLLIYDDVTNIPRTRVKGEISNVYLDDKRVDRDILENLILYKKSLCHANRSLKEIYKNADGKNMNYFSYNELTYYLGALFIEALKNGVLVRDKEEVIDIEKYETQIENLKSSVSEYKGKLRSQEDNVSLIESLKKEVQQQKDLLASKGNIISDLTAEVKRLNEELQSFYSEDEFIDEDDDEENISIEEMVEFLNNFKILLLGGRENLTDKLDSLGLKNINQITNHSIFSSTVINADFIVINSKFISHKLVRIAQERYKSKLDCFIYYNGTNPDGLIKACYDYINNWLN